MLVPELQHQEDPEAITVKRRVVRVMEPEQFLHGARHEVATLESPSREQRVPSQLSEAPVLLEPVARGQTEAVLDFNEGRFGQEVAEGSLEDVALLCAPHLVLRGEGGHELHERMMQEREAHADPGRLRRPHHLEEIVVGEGDLEIDVEQPIELGGAAGGDEVATSDAQRPVRGDPAEETGLEQPLSVLAHEELARVEAIGIRSRGPLDVAVRLPDEAGSLRGEAASERLDEPAPEQARNAVIAGEDSLAPIALVAAEDLIAAVTGEEDPHARLARIPGAQVGGQRRVVAERLVVGLNDVREALERLVGRDDFRVVSGSEMSSRQFRVLELVVALFLKANGEGLDALAREPAHQAHDHAAVRAAAQERARILGLEPGQGLTHRLRRLTVDGPGGLGFIEAALAVDDVPVLVEADPTVFPHEDLAGGEPAHGPIDRLRCGDCPEVEVGIDGIGVDLPGESRQSKGSLDARAEGDPLVAHGIVETAEAEAIGGQHEPSARRNPEGDSEGATKLSDEIGIVLRVKALEALNEVRALRAAGQLVEIGQVHVGHQRRVARPAAHDSASDPRQHAALDVEPETLGGRGAGKERIPDGWLHRPGWIAVDEAADDAHAAAPWPRSRRTVSSIRASTVWRSVPYMPGRKMRSRPSS